MIIEKIHKIALIIMCVAKYIRFKNKLIMVIHQLKSANYIY